MAKSRSFPYSLRISLSPAMAQALDMAAERESTPARRPAEIELIRRYVADGLERDGIRYRDTDTGPWPYLEAVGGGRGPRPLAYRRTVDLSLPHSAALDLISERETGLSPAEPRHLTVSKSGLIRRYVAEGLHADGIRYRDTPDGGLSPYWIDREDRA